MKRRARKVITFDALLAVNPVLAQHHINWTDSGFAVTRAQIWPCRDGSHTVRIVWRKREGCVNTSMVYVLRGARVA